MARSDFERRARRFADRIQHLLNNTVANSEIVRATVTPDPGLVTVAAGLPAWHSGPRAVELITADPSCPLYLDMRILLAMDDESERVTVRSSYFGVQGVRDASEAWFHYDYERDKEGYPDAHLQVQADLPELVAAMRVLCRSRKRKKLGNLHFPYGGSPPELGVVIQFLVDEELVVPKDGWEKELERFRESTELALLA